MTEFKRIQLSDSNMMPLPGVNGGQMVLAETLQTRNRKQQHAALSHGALLFEAEHTLSSAA